MMTAMTEPVSQAARARAGATAEFVDLCKALYGAAVDPDVVWDEVIKSLRTRPICTPTPRTTGPGWAPPPRARQQRPGPDRGRDGDQGTALRDERLRRGRAAGGGPGALRRTGQKIPAPISGKKGNARGGARAGRAGRPGRQTWPATSAIAQTLSKDPKKQHTSKRLRPNRENSKEVVEKIKIPAR